MSLVGNTYISGRWIETGVIRLASRDGLLHGFIDFQDNPLRAILAKLPFVLTLDDWEGIHDVIDIIACDAIEVEVGGIEFAAQQEAPLFVPAERRARVAAVSSEGFHIPSGVGEFEDTRTDPRQEGLRGDPITLL